MRFTSITDDFSFEANNEASLSCTFFALYFYLGTELGTNVCTSTIVKPKVNCRLKVNCKDVSQVFSAIDTLLANHVLYEKSIVADKKIS